MSKQVLKVLLVEDDEDDKFFLQEIIQETHKAQFRLEWAATYQSGVEIMRECRHDVYLVDYRLGTDSGIQLLQEARQIQCDAPIIILTSLDDDRLDEQAMHLGAADYLVKGKFDATLLERTILHAIERAEHLRQLQSAQQQNNLLAAAIRHTTTGVVVTDPHQPDNPIIYANQAFLKLTEYDEAEVLGRNCRFLQGPETDGALTQQMREAIAERKPFSDIIFNYRKDGTPFWNEVKINPIFDENANLINFLGIQTDVTARIQAEAIQSQLAAIVESSPDAIYSRTIDGTIVSWNRGAEALYGYTAAEIVGQSVSILIPPESEKEVEVIRHGILQGERFESVETLRRSKSGNLLNVSLSISPIKDAQGHVTGAAIIARDISVRKRYEDYLKETNRRMTRIWESITDGFYALNNHWNFTYVNPQAAPLLQRDPQDLIGKNIWDEFPEAVDSSFYRQFHEATASRQSVDFETFYVPLDAWFEVHAYPSEEGIAVYFRDITERKQTQDNILSLNAKLERRLQRLTALRQIDMAISGSLDLRLTLSVFLYQVTDQLKVDAADVLLLNPHTHTLERAAGRGFYATEGVEAPLMLGEGYAGRAALERQTIFVPDLAHPDASFKHPPTLAGENFMVYYGVPLIAKGHVKGVLEVFHRSPLEHDSEWVDFLETLAGQAAIAIDNASLFNDLERSNTELSLAYDTTIEGWSHALDLRDKETEGHSLRVTELTVRLARAMSFSDAEMIHIRRGALLHDIGKMGVPDAILLKPGSLTDDEWEIMRKHPVYAFELLSPIPFLRPALDIPYCHHEKWAGTGYPRAIHGEQIPLSARIFAVIDVWDALTSDRPYRAAWTKEKALDHIQSQAGQHFDPRVVEVFTKLLTS